MANAQEELARLRAQHGAEPNVGGIPLSEYVAANQKVTGVDPVAAKSAADARAAKEARASLDAKAELLRLRQQAGVSDIDPGMAGDMMVTTSTAPALQTDPYQDPMSGGNIVPGTAPGPKPDSEAGMRRMRQEEGVSFDKGLPFFQRLRLAQESRIPRRKMQVLQEMIADLPEGVNIQWDPLLEQWYFPMRITESDVRLGREEENNIGKFRYVALDEEAFSFADFADMFQADEVLSMGMAMAGAGKFQKMVSIPSTGFKAKAMRFGAEAGGQAGLGAMGRIGGDLYRTGFSMLASGGEFIPTAAELGQIIGEDASIEVAAGILGEFLGRGLGWSAEKVQEAVAVMSGKWGVRATAEEVADWNASMRHSREDLRTIRDVHGEKDYYMTEGEAYMSIPVLEKENSLRKNMRDETKRRFEVMENRSRAAGARAARDTLEIGEPDMGYSGLINRASESFADNNVVVASVATSRDPYNFDTLGQERVTFSFKNTPKVAEGEDPLGVVVLPGGRDGTRQDTWQVISTRLPDELRNTGVSDDLYLAAAREARVHNRQLTSDSTMSEDAVNMWERMMATHDEFKGVKRSKAELTKYEDADGRTWYQTEDGSPVFEFPKRESLVPRLLKPEFTRPTINSKTGEVKTPSTISGIFRGEGSSARAFNAQLWDEVDNNAFARRDLMEAFYNDYRWSVFDPKTGKIDPERFMKWKKETSGFAGRMFTPEEYLKIKRPGGLEQVLSAESRRLESLDTSLRKTFNLGDTFNFSTITGEQKGQLWQKYTKLSPQQRRRAMYIMEQTGMADEFRGYLFQDISKVFTHAMNAPRASQALAQRITKEIDAKTSIIRDMFPGQAQRAQEYIEHLRFIGRTLQRRGAQNSVKGIRQEANPNVLALTRVIFGPLSRAQRFLTAARRVQTRSMGENAIRIIQDPEQLRELVQLKNYPIQSRQAAQLLTRLGFAEAFGGNDGPADLNDPEVMQDFVNWMREVEAAASEE
jgi:hypothetical protein